MNKKENDFKEQKRKVKSELKTLNNEQEKLNCELEIHNQTLQEYASKRN